MVDPDRQGNPFFGQHLVSVRQREEYGASEGPFLLQRKNLMRLMDSAMEIRDARQRHEAIELLRGYAVCIAFYQESTRTNTSFGMAASLLSAAVVNHESMQFSSSHKKGETLEDTMRAFAQYGDLTVLRHPENDSSQRAAAVSTSPVVNAGSGTGEHPSQALTDILTIRAKLQTIDNLKVALVGDMLFGRTVKSLAWLLAQMGRGNELYFVAADELQMPDEYLNTLPNGTNFHLVKPEDMNDVVRVANVVYMTRTQREWFEQAGMADKYEGLAGALTMTAEKAAAMHQDAIIMHPLPRTVELEKAVDSDPRAVYFDQMGYGLDVRMALLHAILREDALD